MKGVILMKLSSVTIKGMHNVTDRTYNLSKFNYIHGNNGVGKSTILQAVQLALLGYIPNSDKTKSAIFKHSNSNIMSVKLTFDTGTTLERTFIKSTKDITSNVIVTSECDISELIGDLELPIFNFSEFMNLTANKMKDWFIKFLPQSDSNIDWDKELHDSISSIPVILDTDFVSETIRYANELSTTQTGVELVRNFNTYLKEQQSAMKGQQVRIQNTIQSLVFYNDCNMDQDIESLKSDIADRQIVVQKLAENLYAARINAECRNKLQQLEYSETYNPEIDVESNLLLNEEYTSLSDSIFCNNEELMEIDSKCGQLNEIKRSIDAKIGEITKVTSGKGVCPYTSLICEPIVNQIDNLNSELTLLSSQAAEIKSDLDKLALRRNKLKMLNNSYKSKQDSIAVAYSTIGATYAKMTDCAESPDEISTKIESIKSEIDSISETIIQIKANRKYNELIQNITSEKFKIEQNLEILKLWIKYTDVNGLQTKLMTEPFNTLADSMTVYINKLFPTNSHYKKASFFLENKANSFSFGVITDTGTYIEYDLLSSGEKCLYMLALLISIVDISKSKLKLIMIDDFLDHLDDDRAVSCFNAMHSISDDIQIILAGVKDSKFNTHSEYTIEL